MRGEKGRGCIFEVSLLLMFLLKKYTIEIRRDVIFILIERLTGVTYMKVLLRLIITLSLMIAWMPTCIYAEGDQEIVARNYLRLLHSDKEILSSEIIEANRLAPDSTPIAVAQLFNLNGDGYILVAASRNLTPIKAYSLTGNFETLPPAYKTALLNELEAQLRAMQADTGRTVQSDAVSETGMRWDFLLNFNSFRLPLSFTPDTYLLQTKWNQDYPYNKFAPKISGQATYAGCANTAIAQVLRYYKYPTASKGVVSYIWKGQTLKAILYKA